MRSVAVCLASLAILCASPALAAPPPLPPQTVAQLLAALAKSPGVYARYAEKKSIALLAAPLESEGELFYAAPGLLARYTRKPEPSIVVLDPQRLRMHDGKSWQTLDFANKPLIRQFAESFVNLLRGDLAKLEQQYRLDWTPPTQQDPRWRLVLRPRQAPLDQLIARMELHGQGLVIREMRVLEVGGDETVTAYSAVDPARVYGPAERMRVFALEKP